MNQAQEIPGVPSVAFELLLRIPRQVGVLRLCWALQAIPAAVKSAEMQLRWAFPLPYVLVILRKGA
jgi:hypothetical protein